MRDLQLTTGNGNLHSITYLVSEDFHTISVTDGIINHTLESKHECFTSKSQIFQYQIELVLDGNIITGIKCHLSRYADSYLPLVNEADSFIAEIDTEVMVAKCVYKNPARIGDKFHYDSFADYIKNVLSDILIHAGIIDSIDFFYNDIDINHTEFNLSDILQQSKENKVFDFLYTLDFKSFLSDEILKIKKPGYIDKFGDIRGVVFTEANFGMRTQKLNKYNDIHKKDFIVDYVNFDNETVILRVAHMVPDEVPDNEGLLHEFVYDICVDRDRKLITIEPKILYTGIGHISGNLFEYRDKITIDYDKKQWEVKTVISDDVSPCDIDIDDERYPTFHKYLELELANVLTRSLILLLNLNWVEFITKKGDRVSSIDPKALLKHFLAGYTIEATADINTFNYKVDFEFEDVKIKRWDNEG